MSIAWYNGFGPEEHDPKDEFEQAQEMCAVDVDEYTPDDDEYYEFIF